MICARFSFPTGVFRACTRLSSVFLSSSLSSRNRRLISSLSLLACPSPFSKYIIVAGCTTYRKIHPLRQHFISTCRRTRPVELHVARPCSPCIGIGVSRRRDAIHREVKLSELLIIQVPEQADGPRASARM